MDGVKCKVDRAFQYVETESLPFKITGVPKDVVSGYQAYFDQKVSSIFDVKLLAEKVPQMEVTPEESLLKSYRPAVIHSTMVAVVVLGILIYAKTLFMTVRKAREFIKNQEQVTGRKIFGLQIGTITANGRSMAYIGKTASADAIVNACRLRAGVLLVSAFYLYHRTYTTRPFEKREFRTLTFTGDDSFKIKNEVKQGQRLCPISQEILNPLDPNFPPIRYRNYIVDPFALLEYIINYGIERPPIYFLQQDEYSKEDKAFLYEQLKKVFRIEKDDMECILNMDVDAAEVARNVLGKNGLLTPVGLRCFERVPGIAKMDAQWNTYAAKLVEEQMVSSPELSGGVDAIILQLKNPILFLNTNAPYRELWANLVPFLTDCEFKLIVPGLGKLSFNPMVFVFEKLVKEREARLPDGFEAFLLEKKKEELLRMKQRYIAEFIKAVPRIMEPYREEKKWELLLKKVPEEVRKPLKQRRDGSRSPSPSMGLGNLGGLPPSSQLSMGSNDLDGLD